MHLVDLLQLRPFAYHTTALANLELIRRTREGWVLRSTGEGDRGPRRASHRIARLRGAHLRGARPRYTRLSET
jgi:hypothetical protein